MANMVAGVQARKAAMVLLDESYVESEQGRSHWLIFAIFFNKIILA